MKNAYISLITNKEYLPGLLALAYSLRQTNTKIDFKVLIPEQSDALIRNTLEQHQILYVTYQEEQDEVYGTGYWHDTLAKLRVFEMMEYSKIVFLDADMIILKNIDILFTKPHMSAVAAGKVLHPDWRSLNSGIIVIEPEVGIYGKLRQLAVQMQAEHAEKGLTFGDQDVINAYYPDWGTFEERQLPETMNTMLGYAGVLMEHNAITCKEDLYVYHFTGKEKPWGTALDRAAILLKMLKRSRHCTIDFSVYKQYRKMLNYVNSL